VRPTPTRESASSSVEHRMYPIALTVKRRSGSQVDGRGSDARMAAREAGLRTVREGFVVGLHNRMARGEAFAKCTIDPHDLVPRTGRG
jgi:hypothetical protein